VVLSKGYTKAYGFRGDGSITYSAGYCTSAYKPKPFVANTQRNGTYYEFNITDGRYYYLTIIHSEDIRKYRIWYFGGNMFEELMYSKGNTPVVSLDINTVNLCKLTLADWGYITVMFEEDSSGLYQ
jgi:hypothetical protein